MLPGALKFAWTTKTSLLPRSTLLQTRRRFCLTSVRLVNRRCLLSQEIQQSKLTGMQIQLPPLHTWGKDPVAFCDNVLCYANRVSQVGRAPGYLVFRFFPDSLLVRTKMKDSAPGGVPPLSAFWDSDVVWSGVSTADVLSNAMNCFSSLKARLDPSCIPVVCFPTRSIVTKRFMERFFSHLYAMSWRHIAVELPSSRILRAASVSKLPDNTWCTLGALHNYSEREVGLPLSHGSFTAHSTVPLHALFPWVLEEGLFSPFELWLVADTIPLENGNEKEHSLVSQNAAQVVSFDSESVLPSCSSQLPHFDSKENTNKEAVIEVPDENAKAAIMQSIMDYEMQKEDPFRAFRKSVASGEALPFSTLVRETKMSEEAKQKDILENMHRIDDDKRDVKDDVNCVFDAKYWKEISIIASATKAVGAMSMPTYHTSQTEKWINTAKQNILRSFLFIHVVPPAFSATELNNYQLLREGDLNSQAIGKDSQSRWLPKRLLASLKTKLEELPLRFVWSERDEFFEEFLKLRSVSHRRHEVVISKDSSGAIRLKTSSAKVASLQFASPWEMAQLENLKASKYPKQKIKISSIQDHFRKDIVLPYLTEAAAFCKEHQQIECSSRKVHSLMLSIQPPGIRDDALITSWKCLSEDEVVPLP